MTKDQRRLQEAMIYYPRLRRVRDYVEHNYSDDISLCEAARIAHLEEKYFSTYFHRKTGICFKAWLAQVRIGHAKSMMEQENCSITEVAFAVGFRDLRTFERSFKRYTDMTPRAFKNSVRPS